MNSKIKLQLSFMMFLEFFIWGGWFVTLGIYLPNTLGASGSETALAYSSQSWGAIIAPFIIGLIADRYFNAERILGVLHLIGAFLMYQMASADDISIFVPYVFGYMIGNDVSARDFQYMDVQFTRAKTMDTFTPIGPWRSYCWPVSHL